MKEMLLLVGFGMMGSVIGTVSAAVYLFRTLRPTMTESSPVYLGTPSLGEFSSSRFLQNH
ncbi:MAG: hypothetical protein BWK79_04215 [Beggiatoa sp. IS2]|nr:MAG: hypothetical protein BWK79_04215 [Beggiatoa sp. IS2]